MVDRTRTDTCQTGFSCTIHTHTHTLWGVKVCVCISQVSVSPSAADVCDNHLISVMILICNSDASLCRHSIIRLLESELVLFGFGRVCVCEWSWSAAVWHTDLYGWIITLRLSDTHTHTHACVGRCRMPPHPQHTFICKRNALWLRRGR